MQFLNSKDERVDVVEEIKSCISCGYDCTLYVGTDSQVHTDKNKTVYATVIVVHKKTKGGRFFVSKVEKRRRVSLRERLMFETWLSVECALFLVEKFENRLDIVIHIDCNRDKKHESGKFVEDLVGMVVSQGFKCVVKPDSFAANKVADRASR